MKIKTLVIHPEDVSTDFLKASYANLHIADKVITTNISRTNLKLLIKQYDTIIMMGHGTQDGLIMNEHLIINKSFVELLRTKKCYYIWCNADLFLKRYNLTGICTGMFISEIKEAVMYQLKFTESELRFSNSLFATLLSNLFLDIFTVDNIINMYNTSIPECDIIEFNSSRIFEYN